MNINHPLVKALNKIDDLIEYRGFSRDQIKKILFSVAPRMQASHNKTVELKRLSEDHQEYGRNVNNFEEIQRVVCAACRWPDLHIIIGIRHWSPDMHLSAHLQGYDPKDCKEQGFVDQWGNWLTREEAKKIAMKRGQIIERGAPEERKLYSEDLY